MNNRGALCGFIASLQFACRKDHGHHLFCAFFFRLIIRQVGPLAAYYQVPLCHILLVYDEMSLPNGILRLQPKGGHGYHNGYCSPI
ncbi:hypothetical protein RHMOL_Rhmol08G0095100 [Rhododendron molle]|uniref:Uncharacterized protein n=1 Tax=Rhododendron molle TaxID=49168 RepID=A0ACC0MLW0_RHOML|nr:hypothetical protein RHMOL_Rhmol08G0095100 [Rhododendron molle]